MSAILRVPENPHTDVWFPAWFRLEVDRDPLVEQFKILFGGGIILSYQDYIRVCGQLAESTLCGFCLLPLRWVTCVEFKKHYITERWILTCNR